MNNFRTFFASTILACVPFAVTAQTAKTLADHIKTIEIRLNDPNAERTWQYHPDGEDFVCVNGTNRYTRALYGSHNEDRVETSDRPVFVTFKSKDSRNVSFKLNGLDLVDAERCEARYTPGRRTYVLTDRRWGNGIVRIAVLAHPDRQGGIWKVATEGFEGKAEMMVRVCEIRNQRLKRWGDMGAEVPGSLEAATKPKQLQTETWNVTNNTTYISVENLQLKLNVPSSLYEKAEEYRQQLASQIIFRTPDPYINTLGGALVMAGDGAWDGDTFLHGAIVWRVQLPGWRGAYMGDFLGWPDRARRHFDAYAESQVKDVPCTIPHATPDSALNLCRARHEWGTPMYSNGYICRTPHRRNVMHHYDMNLSYIDELLWHMQFDADTAYLRKMWPVITRHLDWEKLNFDPDGDHLYDAYCCIWASDGLYYNSGAVTHSSAYNYRHNLLAARIAEILGENGAPYREEADAILKAMNERLWTDGHWAEYQDFMGLQRLHESAALWSIYTPIDCYACSPEQAYMATRWVDSYLPHIPIRIKGEEPQYYLLSTTRWMPYDWSINNVAHAEVMHTALAYFHAGRTDEAFRLMKGTLLDEMYLGGSPANLGQVSYYDAARGETYRDFADNVGVTAKAAIEGLYGISPQALYGKLVIRPGFPSSWDSASIHTPYIDYSFRREGDKEIYDITQRFAQPLQLVIRQNTGRGRYKETVFTSDRTQHIVLDAVHKEQEMPVDMYAWAKSDNAGKDIGCRFNDIDGQNLKPVNISRHYNANLTDIFKNEYTSPASPYTTLRIPKNGFGEWCHPTFTASTNDSVFRSLVKDGIYRACLKDQGKTIPFRSAASGANIAYTSLWDNYPDSITVSLSGKATHAYLMLAGTTNPMQSRITNGCITVTYTDGTSERLELVNPDNWCPIEQDYYTDQYAFRVESQRPYRVHLMSDIVSRNLGDDLQLKGVYGRLIDGGAAQLLDMPLNPEKKLRSLTVRTLSNDVVIGLMAVTLQKK